MKLSVWSVSLTFLVIINSACDSMSEANEGKIFSYSQIK